MVLRLVLSLAFVGAVLWFAARVAKKRGLGGASEVIEVVARQRMGRTSTVSVLRVAGRVLVVGATDAQISILAELEDDELRAALAERAQPAADADPGTADAEGAPRPTALPLPRAGSGALAGSVLDKGTWTSMVQELRERTVRRP
ncbi:flagellar biosynthetic protein FliO [Modestobacter sp. NPDC049651]|uniref:FliO/MopB family protein n=1 Tax=unclassified Modestobacter TaxID=2643866 RepID=UPI0033E08542